MEAFALLVGGAVARNQRRGEEMNKRGEKVMEVQKQNKWVLILELGALAAFTYSAAIYDIRGMLVSMFAFFVFWDVMKEGI